MSTQSSTVIADAMRPALPVPVWLVTATQVATGALVIALAAQVHFYLPGTPVPFTLQTLVVLLTGAALGRRNGTLAVVVYIAGGALGLPLFSAGGFGLAKLAGPTGGYLLGFIAAAWLAGLIAERGGDRRLGSALPGMLAGMVVIYACGLAWLGLFTGYDRVFTLGLYPFLAADLAKVGAAGLLLPGFWRLLGCTTR